MPRYRLVYGGLLTGLSVEFNSKSDFHADRAAMKEVIDYCERMKHDLKQITANLYRLKHIRRLH